MCTWALAVSSSAASKKSGRMRALFRKMAKRVSRPLLMYWGTGMGLEGEGPMNCRGGGGERAT